MAMLFRPIPILMGVMCLLLFSSDCLAQSGRETLQEDGSGALEKGKTLVDSENEPKASADGVGEADPEAGDIPLDEPGAEGEGLSAGGNSSKPTVAQLARSYIQFVIGYAIQRYYLPIIVPIGFVGNCLSLAVMLQRHNRRVSCCVYMIALAISDNMMLFSGVYLWAIAEVAPRNWNLYECKFVCYCFGTFGLAGVYLILFMTFDRWVAVNFPFKASRWCTVKRARLTSVLVIVVSLVYEIPHFLYSGVIGGKQCAPFTYSNPYVVAYTMVNLTLNAFVPFTLIFIMNIMIIRTIMKRQDSFSHGEGDAGKQDSSLKENERKQQQAKQLVAMLLLISFALVFLTFPQYIRYVIWRFVDQRQSPAHFATYVLFFNVSNKMFYTNNAINFFLYCAGGSKFRNDLKAIVTCGLLKSDWSSSKMNSSSASTGTVVSKAA